MWGHNRVKIHTTLIGFFAGILVMAFLLRPAHGAGLYADVLCYYEQGLHASTGYWTPENAVSPDGATKPSGVVSLGSWSDDPDHGQDYPVGLLVGFSASIANGTGADLFVHGNAFSNWFEPGFVEVARETSGVGATVDGWMDETFFLIRPSNYDALPNDPRQAPISMSYMSEHELGYADVFGDSEYMDLDWAIDDAGTFVVLPDIAYVRIRTVTDDAAGVFGYYTTDVDYVEGLNGTSQVPIPAAVWLLGAGLLSVMGIRSKDGCG
ncbi:MAG: VPLPA-CTERM sorting domain-containing protein [Deltaproteobacteria bacterium]|nr:VPLPA-CTERM sorting domain-containing protein [Deltaproteobacteria bacterium]